MSLRADEISSLIEKQIQGFDESVELKETGRVISVGDGIARIYGLGNAMSGELLEFPGGRHDDRVDCVAYAVQVWRDRTKHLNAAEYVRGLAEVYKPSSPGPFGSGGNGSNHYSELPTLQPRDSRDIADVHPADRPARRRVRARDRWGA